MKWPLMPQALTWMDRVRMIKFLLTSDRLTAGPQIRKFERDWNTWLGSSHSVMVSSGSTANFLLLASVKEKYKLAPGSKVLLPACTWVTNVAPVMQLGLQPVFCDINLNNFSFDPEHLDLIAQSHPDIALVFVTHLLGIPAPVAQIKQLWPHALILDDVCESHGAVNDQGFKVGQHSLGATFSFYWGHHITSVEGGIISTCDSDLWDLMRVKRSHGLARESAEPTSHTHLYPEIHPQFLFVSDGYNFRSQELNAVLAQSQLRRLDAHIQQRRANYAAFVNVTEQFEHLLHPLQPQSGNSSFCLPFVCKSRDVYHKLKQQFDQHDIEHRPIVGGNLLTQPFLQGHTWGAPLPRPRAHADVVNYCGIYIGNNQFVTVDQVQDLKDILETL